MANHLKPEVTDTYAQVLSLIDDRFDDLSRGLDPNKTTTTPTGLAANSVRWMSSNKRWEVYDGTSTWSELSASYSININGTVGATTPAAGSFTTLSTNSTTNLASGATVNNNAIVDVSTSQTLTSKTLTTPVINNTASGTVAGRLGYDGTNKVLTYGDGSSQLTVVELGTTQTLTNKTLTSPTLTTPKIVSGGGIYDTAGTPVSYLLFSTVASAVNQITIANAATLNKPTISATGTDTNITLNLVSKGTGTVQANGVDVVTTSGTQTLTNKTFTTPNLGSTASGANAGNLGYNGGNLTYGDGAQRTVVNTDSTQTLTNKTMSTGSTWGGSNIPLGNGGTNAALTAAAGAIPYSTATALALTAAGTTAQILQSNGTSAPTWANFDISIHATDMSFKKEVVVATAADLGVSTATSTVLTGYPKTVALNCTTTAGSATITTTSTAGIKIGSVVSGNANIPGGATVTSISSSTTFVINSGVGTGVLAASAVSTTFTNTIAAISVDGITLSLNDRVLVKDQSTLGGLFDSTAAIYNGIYYVSATGDSSTTAWTLTRTADGDSSADLDGCTVTASRGNTNATKTFKIHNFNSSTTFSTGEKYFNRLLDVSGSALYTAPSTARGFDIDIESRSITLKTTGTTADLVSTAFGIPNLSAAATSTYSRASTVYIAGAPTAQAGGNVTISAGGAYALYVAGGASFFGGTINGLTLSSTGFSSAAATNLTIGTGTTGVLTLDSGTTGAVNIGGGANAKTVTIGNTTGATGVVINTGTANMLVGTNTALTNTVNSALKIAHYTSGTAAVGIGTALDFETETANTVNKIGTSLRSVSTSVTGAAESFDFVVSLMSAGAAAAEKLRVTAAGNLGLGVTPSAWVAGSKALQTGTYTALSNATGGDSNLTNNVYLSAASTWTAIASLGASRYQLDFGAHKWYTAPSGTAGNSITFTQAMTLDANGNLGIGTSSPSFKLHVVGGSTAAQFSPTTSTDPAIIKFSNAGTGDVFIGKDNSAGSAFGGGTAYSANFYNGANTPMLFWTNAVKQMTLDASGNLGLGVTPSSWVGKAIEIGPAATGFLFNDSNNTNLGSNAYYNAGWKYQTSSVAASRYAQSSGGHTWYTAPSGTAGAAVTFTQAMTLSSSGTLAIGTGTDITPSSTWSGHLTIGGAGYAGGLSLDASGMWIGHNSTGRSLIFAINETEVARFNTSGSLISAITSGSTTTSAFYGATSGGSFSTMYGRYAPYRTSVAHTGSSYAPAFSMYYEYTSGYAGQYSLGHLTTNSANPGNFVIHHIGSSGIDNRYWTFEGATGTFTAPGNIVANSDEKLKKDWSNLAPNFIEELAKVKSGTYTRIDSGERQVGVSAQSLQQVIPEAVIEGECLSVAYGHAALAAVVELAKEIVALKRELAELKSSINQ